MVIHGSMGEASGTARVSDVQVRLRLWAAQADSADEFALVLALASATDDPDPELLARALLCQGDPSAALSVLGSPSDPLPSADASFSARDLLVAACRAALGDATAYAWLLRSSSLMVDRPRGWFGVDLVAVAADLRSEPEVADRAYRLEAERFGINTPRVAGRLVAAHVAERPTEDGVAVTRQFAEAATTLERGFHPIAHDPRPTLAAAEALVARGDVPGARLLLEFVTRRNHAKGRIAERLAQVSPRSRMRRHGLLAATLIALSPLLLLLQAAAMPVGGVLVYSFRRWITIPGLSRTESVAWRGVRRVQCDRRTGQPASRNPAGGLLALGAIAGGIVGIIVGYQIMPALPKASEGVQATVLLMLTVMSAALGGISQTGGRASKAVGRGPPRVSSRPRRPWLAPGYAVAGRPRPWWTTWPLRTPIGTCAARGSLTKGVKSPRPWAARRLSSPVHRWGRRGSWPHSPTRAPFSPSAARLLPPKPRARRSASTSDGKPTHLPGPQGRVLRQDQDVPTRADRPDVLTLCLVL